MRLHPDLSLEISLNPDFFWVIRIAVEIMFTGRDLRT
jgi:hypothetical protein